MSDCRTAFSGRPIELTAWKGRPTHQIMADTAPGNRPLPNKRPVTERNKWLSSFDFENNHRCPHHKPSNEVSACPRRLHKILLNRERHKAQGNPANCHRKVSGNTEENQGARHSAVHRTNRTMQVTMAFRPCFFTVPQSEIGAFRQSRLVPDQFTGRID